MRPMRPMRPRKPTSGSRASRLLLHPLVVVSVFVLLVNDHWWKGRGPDVVTGKLSDLAGAIVLTALAVGAVGRTPRARCAIGCSVVAVSALAKLTTTGAAAAGWIAGITRWPIDVALTGSWVGPTPGMIVVDPTDLLPILAGVGVVVLLGARLDAPAPDRPEAAQPSGSVRASV